MYILCFGKTKQVEFWICVLLTLFGWLPGIIYAIWVLTKWSSYGNSFSIFYFILFLVVWKSIQIGSNLLYHSLNLLRRYFSYNLIVVYRNSIQFSLLLFFLFDRWIFEDHIITTSLMEYLATFSIYSWLLVVFSCG